MTSGMTLTRAAVWNLMCDLEMNVRYYGTKADRVRRHFIRIRFILLTSLVLEAFLIYWGTTGSAALFVAIVFGICVAALTVWDALVDYSATAAILRVAADGCDDLKFEAERLWRNIEDHRVTRDAAEREYERIHERWSRVAARVTTQDDVNLCKQCSEESNAIMRDRYAA